MNSYPEHKILKTKAILTDGFLIRKYVLPNNKLPGRSLSVKISNTLFLNIYTDFHRYAGNVCNKGIYS